MGSECRMFSVGTIVLYCPHEEANRPWESVTSRRYKERIQFCERDSEMSPGSHRVHFRDLIGFFFLMSVFSPFRSGEEIHKSNISRHITGIHNTTGSRLPTSDPAKGVKKQKRFFSVLLTSITTLPRFPPWEGDLPILGVWLSTRSPGLKSNLPTLMFRTSLMYHNTEAGAIEKLKVLTVRLLLRPTISFRRPRMKYILVLI